MYLDDEPLKKQPKKFSKDEDTHREDIGTNKNNPEYTSLAKRTKPEECEKFQPLPHENKTKKRNVKIRDLKSQLSSPNFIKHDNRRGRNERMRAGPSTQDINRTSKSEAKLPKIIQK